MRHVTVGRFPEIAATIRTARLRKGISQESAAAQVGMSRFHWIRLEQGLHRPTEFASQIAEVLGVSERDLLGDDDDEEAASMRSAREAELLEALRPVVRLLTWREPEAAT